jgi:outer membrane protein
VTFQRPAVSPQDVARPGHSRAGSGVSIGPRLPGVLLALAAGIVVALPATAQERAPAEVGAVQSLTLGEALSRALDGSRTLTRARFALEEAEGQVKEAWSGVLPRLDLNAAWTRNLTVPSSFFPAIFFDETASPDELVRVAFGADNQWSSTLSLEQPIFEGRALIGIGAAARFRALQEEVLRGTELETVTRVRLLYYDLLLAQEQARLLERSVERVRASLEETRALARAGLSSEYDVLRLEVEVANLEPQLRRALNEARARERELITELDLPEGTRVELQGALVQLDLENPAANEGANREIVELMGPPPPDATDAAAVAARFAQVRGGASALRQVELNSELRQAELRAEQSEFLPRVSLFGNYQVQAQQDGSPTFFGRSGQRAYGRNVGIQVSLPIFTGRQRTARVEQRRAALRASEIEIDEVGDRLHDQFVGLLEEAEEALLRVRGQALAVRQADRGYQIASAQYREGLGSQLELTDAEVALRQSEFNYAGAVFDYLATRARLDELGGEVPMGGIGR